MEWGIHESLQVRPGSPLASAIIELLEQNLSMNHFKVGVRSRGPFGFWKTGFHGICISSRLSHEKKIDSSVECIQTRPCDVLVQNLLVCRSNVEVPLKTILHGIASTSARK